MMRSIFILFIVLAALFTANNSYSATYFSWNCKQAYQSILNLDLETASEHLKKEKEDNTDNIFVPYLRHYSAFVKYYVRPESETIKQLWDELQLYEYEITSNTTANGYWRDYFKAEIQLQKALIELNEQNYVSGFFQLRSAYLYSKDVVDKAVIGHPAEKTLAVTEALFSVVPDNYQWVLRLLSIDASLNSAEQKLIKLSENPLLYFNKECIMLSAALNLHLGGNAMEAYDLIKSDESRFRPLFQIYLEANAANYAGLNDIALETMENVPFLFYQRFPLMFYLRGKLYLQKLDDQSEKWFKFFLTYNQAEHLVKSTYQYLSWGTLLQGDLESFNIFRSKILKNGIASGEADKAAQKAAMENITPKLDILKSRLLFDGGYYKEALVVLESDEVHQLSLEKYYRLGRIYHALNNIEKALSYYKKVMGIAPYSGAYEPANCAYLSGQIYIKQNKVEKAREYFEKVFEYKEHTYKLSLDQKAKTALRQIRKTIE